MAMVSSERSDALLIEEYLLQKSEAAFEALLRRHGQMVYNVCFRVLRHPQDAEDAAQAVFLTLAHKATGLRNRESLSGWLYQVSWNIAQRAREARVTRSHREVPAENISHLPGGGHQNWDNLLGALDDAITELPEKYRLPMVLHHLQGQSQEQTARILGINANTVATQLLRARAMVRENLERSGMALSAGALTAHLAEYSTGVAIPESLVVSTSKAAALIAAGRPAESSMVSTQAASLARDTIRSMRMKSMKVAAVAVMMMLLVATSAGFAFKALAQDLQPVVVAAPAPGPKPAPVVETPKDPKPEAAVVAAADPLDELVKKLGDAVEENRDDAETALRKEGMKAMAALEKGELSDDLEIKGRSQKLLAVLKFKPVVEGLRAQIKDPEKAADGMPSFKTKFRAFSSLEEAAMDISGSLNVAEKMKRFSLQIKGRLGNEENAAAFIMDDKSIWIDIGSGAGRKVRKIDLAPILPGLEQFQKDIQANGILNLDEPAVPHAKKSVAQAVLDAINTELDVTGIVEESLDEAPMYRITAYVRPMSSETRKETLQEDGQSQLEQLVEFARRLKLNVWLAKDTFMLRKVELTDRNDKVIGLFELTATESNFPQNLDDYAYTPPQDVEVEVLDAMAAIKMVSDFNGMVNAAKEKKKAGQAAVKSEQPAAPPPPPAANF